MFSDILNSVFEYLALFVNFVPAVIWSGVIASFITLGGVYLTSKNSSANLRIQLTHDSNEKSRERSFKLRQDIYMLVASELTSAQRHLSNIPRMNLLEENLSDGTAKFFSAAAQCQLVSSPETALLMLRFMHGFGKLQMRALSSTNEMIEASIAENVASEYVEKGKLEVNKLTSKIAELHQESEGNTSKSKILDYQLEFHTKELGKSWDKQIEALNNKAIHSRIYSKNLLDDLVALSSDQIDVLVSMRSDLGFDSDIEEYRKLLREQHAMILSEFENANFGV